MKQLAYLLLSCATLIASPGCSDSKKDNPAPTGPKEYQVEYTVTSNALESDYISYTNESGGATVLGATPLPATYKVKRTMKVGDTLTIIASIDGGTAASEITCSIKLDGKEVTKQTGRGIDAQAIPVWVIGQ